MTAIAPPSVMSLLLRMRRSGVVLATGTGFVASVPGRSVLITNRHNVTGRHPETGLPLSSNGGIPDEVEIIHNRAGRLGVWVSRVEPLYRRTGEALWKEHPALRERADMAALPLTQVDDVALFPYDLGGGPAIACSPASSVSVVGFPFGITAGGALAVWATGFVASEPEINFGDLPVFLIDCRTRPGQSGSAVIAYRSGGAVSMENGDTSITAGPMWRFLGLYSGRINAESDIGLVWKASALVQLVAGTA